MTIKVDITEVYSLARDFILDSKPVLGELVTNKLLGWLRSRDLAHLTTCCQTLSKHSTEREQVRSLMQVEAFFKKNAAFSDPLVCRAAALSSLLAGEESCKATNARLEQQFLDPEKDIEIMLDRMRHFISKTLGDFSLFLERLPSLTRLTAGATATRSRRRSQPHTKVKSRLSCYPGSLPYIKALATHFGVQVRPRVAFWNRVEFVTKNWKTDRSIACEQEGSLPFQLAFDCYGKERLRRIGVDLSDQTRNQRLALEGSLTDGIATVDLENASNSVAFNAVATLFPYEWFRYLNSHRAVEARIGQRLHRYEMFSSMGNGSTFVIETLIFAAACVAAGAKQWSVYGDDIAIDTDHVEALEAILSWLGFTFNSEKTFKEGPFRESCGVNYYEGIDITPFYIRTLEGRKAHLCHLVNGLVRISHPGSRLWARCLKYIEDWNLPLAPVSENTTSGVHIDVHSAYQVKLLRWNRTLQVPQYKGYQPSVETRVLRNARTYFLWHLDANLRTEEQGVAVYVVFDGVLGYEPIKHQVRRQSARDTAVVRSRYPLPSHYYVRKWIHWHPCSVAGPSHPNVVLFAWSEYLLANRKVN